MYFCLTLTLFPLRKISTLKELAVFFIDVFAGVTVAFLNQNQSV